MTSEIREEEVADDELTGTAQRLPPSLLLRGT